MADLDLSTIAEDLRASSFPSPNRARLHEGQTATDDLAARVGENDACVDVQELAESAREMRAILGELVGGAIELTHRIEAIEKHLATEHN